MIYSNKHIVATFTVLIGVGATSLASAQATLEEIVVTAQKRSESVQDVPIAINALTSEQLNELGVSGFDDIVDLFPNLSLKASSSINSGFSIRGVGTDNFHVTAQQAVGMYVDEVSLPSPFTSQLSIFDMERVEVLRGPQNTLFGRNTTGGAVNYISRKPRAEDGLNGFVRGKFGNEGRADFDGAVGLAFTDNLAVRLAGQAISRDGVFTDVVDNEVVGEVDRYGGRLQAVWTPTENTSVLFNGHAGFNRGDHGVRHALGLFLNGSPNIGTPGARGAPDCPLLTSANPERFIGSNNCVAASNGTVTNSSTNGSRDVRDISSSIADVDFVGAFVKINHEFDSVTFTSITSYDEIEVQFQENTSATGILGFFPGQDADYEVFSQELRLASSVESRIRWIVGGYYSSEDDTLATIIRNGADGTPPFTVVPSVVVEQDVEVLSAYGQIEYDLSDTVTFTGGLRYTSDSKDGTSTSRVIAGTRTGLPGPDVAAPDFFYDLDFIESVTAGGAGQCPPPVGGLPCILGPIPIAQDLNELGGKVGLDWRPTDDTLVYASYSRGFKSGAFDTRALAAFSGNADRPVGPEFLDAYEVGVKSTLLDGRLELNGAIFYYDWEDLQTFSVDETGGAAFLNIPETELVGAEVEFKAVPADGWYLQGGIGYVDTEIKDDGGLVGVAAGSELSSTPSVTISGLIQRELNVNSGALKLQTNFNYTGSFNDSLNSDPFTNHASAFFVNARISFYFGEDEQFEIAVFGDNLTEEKVCRDIRIDGSLTNAVTCSPNPGLAFFGIVFAAEF